MKASGVFKVVIAACALSLIATHLSPATAAPAAQVITCVDLVSGKERISKTGTCRTTEATAKWHLAPTDSALASGSTTKSLTICSNKESSPVTYQRIRTSCYKHMQTSLYTRSAALRAKPVIVQAVSFGHDSASLKLATDLATNADAPIAFYTITINRVDSSTAAKVETKRIYSWRDSELAVTGLQGRTTYTFTVTATTVDGTSAVSLASLPVTTPAYVPSESSASSSNSSTVAAPAFTLSSTAETKTVNNAITGYTVASTGGAIATYSISPTAPTGTTFSASTGLLTGTPTSPQSATAYTITATNAGGSTSAIFTLTVASAPPAAPAFTLSSTAETKTVNNAITGYTIASTGGAIATYAISPAAPAGLTFNTTTGVLSGTPSSTQSATAYTITATNATGSATQTFTLTVSIAAPAFTLSASAETKTVNTAITGYTISSTGGTIASYAISPSAPAGLAFNTTTGVLSGTPSSTQSATAYTITATNASGSASRTFTLTVTSLVYTVGQTGPGGGTVFYVALNPFACGPTRSASCTYLEAAPSGWNTGTDPNLSWATNVNNNRTTTVPAPGAIQTAIGTGYQNSNAIVAQTGNEAASSAAVAARAYRGSGLTDWYLPSRDELNQMCKWARGQAWTSDATVCDNTGTLNSATYGASAAGFDSFFYSSSSETTGSGVNIQRFSDGLQAAEGGKNGAYYVRPIRAF